MSAHAPLPPSGAYRWGDPKGCPGSRAMEARYPEDEESEAAREGTAAHFYLTETLAGRTVEVGSVAPNAEPITADMVTFAQGMMTDCRKVALMTGGKLMIEQRVRMSSIHADCWGTPDVYLIDLSAGVIYVWDYKYGHRYVDPYRNWQLVLYAIGVLEVAGITEWWKFRFSLRICQPRNYHPSGHIRVWEPSGAAMTAFASNLRAAAEIAMKPNAPVQTGDHCRDCSARHACPALIQSAMLSVDIAREQTPMQLTPGALGLLLRYLTSAESRIKALKDALEEQGLHLVRSGQDLPLWRADYSSGRERWSKTTPEVLALGDMFGVDLRKPVDTITPAQARAAGVPEAVVTGFAEKPRGSMKLVPVTDASVAKAFE